MNDALESNHRKQSASYRRSCNGDEDDQTQEAPRVSCGLALKEEVATRALTFGDGHVGGGERRSGGAMAGRSMPLSCRRAVEVISGQVPASTSLLGMRVAHAENGTARESLQA